MRDGLPLYSETMALDQGAVSHRIPGDRLAAVDGLPGCGQVRIVGAAILHVSASTAPQAGPMAVSLAYSSGSDGQIIPWSRACEGHRYPLDLLVSSDELIVKTLDPDPYQTTGTLRLILWLARRTMERDA